VLRAVWGLYYVFDSVIGMSGDVPNNQPVNGGTLSLRALTEVACHAPSL